jgi:hypothetical protein
LQWLYFLGEADDSARRAFELCSSCVRRIAPSGFDLDEFALRKATSNENVPTDQIHQQYRSKLDVPPSQFAGTEDFRYDGSISNIGSALLSPLGATENSEAPQYPSLGIWGADIDMSDYIPVPEYATLDEVLISLTGPHNEAI